MKRINYLTISDIHFGHPRVKSIDILKHFDWFIKEYFRFIKDVDVFFIVGDITDKPLVNGTVDNTAVTAWFLLLVSFAKKHNIKIVVVRGTISHDGKGLETFSSLIEDREDVDYTYIDIIRVITIKGFNILIVPDNTHKTGLEVEKYVEEHILKKGITVDIAMVHRAFHFQLPIEMDESLDMAFWLNNVKHYIHVAHIHTPMTYERIIGQGSFDRLQFGQEETKGAVLTYISPENKRWVFLENKKATIFKRLSYEKVDIPLMLKDIKKYEAGAFIEIVLPKEELKHFNKKALLQFSKGYSVSFSNTTKIKEDKILTQKKVKEYDLSPNNIKKILVERLPKDMKNEASLELEKIYKTMRI